MLDPCCPVSWLRCVELVPSPPGRYSPACMVWSILSSSAKVTVE